MNNPMMQQLVPKIGDWVFHHSKLYNGRVIGYGRRLADETVQITLKVSVNSRLSTNQNIVIEDLASQWERISEKRL